MPDESPELTISAVAKATGVSADLLRAWEIRYRFPTPARLAGGHRRYSRVHVAQIEQVQSDRRAGLSLEAAIDRVRTRSERPETSIFAALRRRWPQQPAQILSRRAAMAISRAIEDEACAHAERPILIGCFQRERYYRQSEPRWRELARTATWAAVFADFATTRTPDSGVIEVAVTETEPLLRDWVVICDSPRFAACIAAVELPELSPGRGRRFETIWSADPAIVREATRVAVGLADPLPGMVGMLSALPDTDAATAQTCATALMNRAVAYLDTPTW